MEIKATDLRIGNWIIDKITGSHGPVTHLHPNDNGIYDGIPLTEELLLKMGFEFKFGRFHFQVGAAEYIIEQQDDWYFIGIRSGDGTVYFVWHLYYLHELQNALYMLGKKELTLS
jgi:hypothetical protein